MLKIDLDKTESDQAQVVELDGIQTDIRVYWVETPDHITASTGDDGRLMMDIKNDLMDIKSISLVLGSELMIPYAVCDFGGFIVVSIDGANPNIDTDDRELMYVPLSEIDEIRKLYGAVV